MMGVDVARTVSLSRRKKPLQHGYASDINARYEPNVLFTLDTHGRDEFVPYPSCQ